MWKNLRKDSLRIRQRRNGNRTSKINQYPKSTWVKKSTCLNPRAQFFVFQDDFESMEIPENISELEKNKTSVSAKKSKRDLENVVFTLSSLPEQERDKFHSFLQMKGMNRTTWKSFSRGVIQSRGFPKLCSRGLFSSRGFIQVSISPPCRIAIKRWRTWSPKSLLDQRKCSAVFQVRND